MDAILSAELLCDTITLEKPSENRKVEPEFSVYRFLDDIYACSAGQYFNRKMLRWASIDRNDFKLWCERRNIPLPEFWFPPGWNLEYDRPEGESLPGHWYYRRDWTSEQWEQWRKQQAEEVGSDSPERIDNPPASESSKEAKAVEKLRPNQEARIACRQIAKAIWQVDPTRTISSVVSDELIQKYGGGDHFVEETVREWIKSVARQEVRRPGRPRKNGGGSE